MNGPKVLGIIGGVKPVRPYIVALLVIATALASQSMSADKDEKARSDDVRNQFDNGPVKSKTLIKLMTPKNSRFLRELYHQYPDPNDEERAYHVSMLRLFYDELDFSETKNPRAVALFRELLDCELADTVHINKIYDEIFLRFNFGLGIGDFRQEIRTRVRTALSIRRDFHEFTGGCILGVGDLAYHVIKLGNQVNIESFGTEKVTRAEDTERVMSVDLETFGEYHVVLYFHSNNMRIKYVKDDIFGYYRAAEVLLKGPEEIPIVTEMKMSDLRGGLRWPTYGEKFASNSTALIMEKVTGAFVTTGPPELSNVHLYPFVFPFPGKWDKNKMLEEQSWDAYGAGVDIYGSLENLIKNDSVDYSIEVLVTDLQDTIFEQSSTNKMPVNSNPSMPGFHQRFYCGIFHHQDFKRSDSSIYSIGWKFMENKSGKEVKAVDIIVVPNRPVEIPHFESMAVAENQGDINRDSLNPYRDIPNFSPPRKWKGSIRLWIPVAGLQADASGRFVGSVDVFLKEHKIEQAGQAKINRESIRYSYYDDGLGPTEEPESDRAAKRQDGYVGTFEINKSGPNGFCTIDVPVKNVKAGTYYAYLFVTTRDSKTNRGRLICTASLEDLRVVK